MFLTNENTTIKIYPKFAFSFVRKILLFTASIILAIIIMEKLKGAGYPFYSALFGYYVKLGMILGPILLLYSFKNIKCLTCKAKTENHTENARHFTYCRKCNVDWDLGLGSESNDNSNFMD